MMISNDHTPTTPLHNQLPGSTSVLIVGGGPVGLMAALTLARYGYTSVVLERHLHRLGQPKAHVLNSRTLEIFRQLGIDINSLREQGLAPDKADVIRFVSSVTGTEYGAIELRRPEEYLCMISPEPTFNLAQPLLEDYLLQLALGTGKVQYFRHHEWKECEQAQDGQITSKVLIRDTGVTEAVQSTYLLGCDGANSSTRRGLQIPFEPLNGIHDEVLHYASVHFSADFENVMPGLLWFVVNATSVGVLICYHPTDSWVYFVGYNPDITPREVFTSDHFKKLVFEAVGKPVKDYQERGVTLWTTAPKAAKSYRSPIVKNAFLAGDAAHTFPPTGGLGVNTGMGDVQNLAWKIHAVEQGWAPDTLLDTFTADRLPVATENGLQSRVNEEKTFNMLNAIMQPVSNGVSAQDSASEQDRKQRIMNAVQDNYDHFDGVDLTTGYVYGRKRTRGASDYQKEVIDGGRLPHCWITCQGRTISSLDLVDGFGFVIVASTTFVRHTKWVDFPGPPVSIKQLGYDFEDPFGEFAGLFGGQFLSAILIRPDQHIIGLVDTIEEASTMLQDHLGCTKRMSSG